MAIAPESLGIGIRRHFTEPGEDPYAAVVWERRRLGGSVGSATT